MAATKNKSDSTEKSQKDESTRKSAPSDNRRTGRVSSTRKSKASAEFKKRSAAAKKGAKSRKGSSKRGEGKSTPSNPRVQDKSNVPINAHGFTPETKVEVYRAVDVDVQRRENRPPVGEVVTTATVSKAGDLNIQRSKLEPGQYVAVGKVDNPPIGAGNRVEGEDFYSYTGFGVVTDEQREKFGSMTGLHGGAKK
jgi:hypothetical protein